MEDRRGMWGVVRAAGMAMLLCGACGGGDAADGGPEIGSDADAGSDAGTDVDVSEVLDGDEAGDGVLARSRAGADLLAVNLNLIDNASLEDIASWAEGLAELGLGWVSIDAHRTMLAGERAAKLEAAVAAVRAMSARLILAPALMEAFGETRPTDIDAFLAETASAFGELAARYRPDFFNVVDEFETQESRLGMTLTTEQWVGFVSTAAAAVKAGSPATITGVSTLAHTARDESLLRACMTVDSLDAIGAHFYDLDHFDVFENVLFPEARARGKLVYCDEAWRVGLCLEWDRLCFLQDKEPLDVEWIGDVAAYAERTGMLFFVPFWTNAFYYYGTTEGSWVAYGAALLDAVARGGRTSLHGAYGSLLRDD